MIPEISSSKDNIRKRINEVIREANPLTQINPDIQTRHTLDEVPYRRRTSFLRKAFCKTDAGGGNTLVCYLDEDESGVEKEITVYFELIGFSDLKYADVYLRNGSMIWVYWDGEYWWHIMPMIPARSVRAAVAEAADSSTYLDCTLSTTGETVSVRFMMSRENDCNQCLPRLEVGDLVTVWLDGAQWRSSMTIFGSTECE